MNIAPEDGKYMFLIIWLKLLLIFCIKILYKTSSCLDTVS
jgi:hypothetical protein